MTGAAPAIRNARPEDAAGIAAIDNDAILHTTATWHSEPVTARGKAAWIAAKRDAGLPLLVVDDADGRVCGYATYGRWRPFDGYRHTVEHSVYVRADCRGRGLGALLLDALIDHARAAGVHVMVAAVEAGNSGSIRLHERRGFVEVGRLPEVGAKFGRWLDLVLLQCTLDDAPAPQAPITD